MNCVNATPKISSGSKKTTQRKAPARVKPQKVCRYVKGIDQFTGDENSPSSSPLYASRTPPHVALIPLIPLIPLDYVSEVLRFAYDFLFLPL